MVVSGEEGGGERRVVSELGGGSSDVDVEVDFEGFERGSSLVGGRVVEEREEVRHERL